MSAHAVGSCNEAVGRLVSQYMKGFGARKVWKSLVTQYGCRAGGSAPPGNLRGRGNQGPLSVRLSESQQPSSFFFFFPVSKCRTHGVTSA